MPVTDSAKQRNWVWEPINGRGQQKWAERADAYDVRQRWLADAIWYRE